MAPREEVAYVTCTYRSTCIEQPDFLATVDLNPRSSTYGQMIEPVDVFWKCNKGYLAVTHALPNGDILIANMGDAAGYGRVLRLGEDSLPLSVRSLHSPDAAEGYVGCALSGAIFRFYRACEATFIADLIISPDDRFMFVCNWLHGDIRQYELRRGCKPRLGGR
ncbi:hypothetical protein DUI87_00192 [Hirundo rustica rustica]|uniref:Methanethiol oxidase n=1 Tax=Hirundo rustica rustica TaxID=333673 RepID=A0A3M0LBX9_HIRRU|nr:hypothetical protein DUI87_00192 [Hirundo rustica rustica]